MSQAIHERLKSFAVGLLEQNGGLVEWPEHEVGGFAVLPPPTAALLECPQTTPIMIESSDRGLSINLASLFLERVERIFPRETSAIALKIDSLYLKKSAMDEPIARAFSFPNARVKVVGTTAERVEYQFWHFAAAIDSDEKWEDVISLTLNSRTHARVQLPDPLTNCDARPARLEDTTPELGCAVDAAAHVAGERAQAFIARLEERMARDMKRLKSYYHALLDDASDRSRRAAFDTDQLASRKKAVELELERKSDELRQRYTIRTTLRPIALVRLDVPALGVTLQVRRRDSENQLPVYWNAITKTLEPLSCSLCGAAIFSVHFGSSCQVLCAHCAAGPKPPD